MSWWVCGWATRVDEWVSFCKVFLWAQNRFKKLLSTIKDLDLIYGEMSDCTGVKPCLRVDLALSKTNDDELTPYRYELKCNTNRKENIFCLSKIWTRISKMKDRHISQLCQAAALKSKKIQFCQITKGKGQHFKSQQDLVPHSQSSLVFLT